MPLNGFICSLFMQPVGANGLFMMYLCTSHQKACRCNAKNRLSYETVKYHFISLFPKDALINIGGPMK